MTETPRGRGTGRSLRVQVAAALAVCAVLFGGAAWGFTGQAYRDDRAAAGARLTRLAGAAAAKLSETMVETERLLGGLATQDAIASFEPGRCQPVLTGFSGIGGGHLVLVAPDGTLRCSSLPGAGGIGSRAYADALWVEAVRRNTAVIRTQVVDPLTRRPGLLVAVPVRGKGSGTAPGALGAVLQLDVIAPSLLGPVEQAQGTTVTVLAPDRTTVLFQSSPTELSGTPGALPVDQLFEAVGADGVRRVYRHTTVTGLGWHLYAASPASVVFAAARHTARQSAALAVVGLGLLAALTVFLLRVAARAQAERVAVLAEARAELQRALVRFTELQEEERRRIAQSLHDQTIQSLLATLWSLEDLDPERAGGRADGAVSTDVLPRVRSNLEAAVAAARSMMVDLRPPALDELGIVAAVEQELQRFRSETGIAVRYEGAVGDRLPAHVETLAFRTIQEALRNVRQHASAGSVRVGIHRRDDVLHVEIEDDGIGVDPAAMSRRRGYHVGIVAMRENIVMGGGGFSIRPAPSGGTAVLFSLPLPAAVPPA